MKVSHASERSVWKNGGKQMNLHKTVVVLLALLLAAMAMVPMVSADISQSNEENKKLIESNFIPVATAQEHATITMLSMIHSGALDENWVGGKINPTPQTIYDINGEKLFYLFTIEKKGARVGEIYAAASKVLGGSVITIGSIETPDKFTVLRVDTQKNLTEKYPGYQVIAEKKVCFDYPVIGLMLTLKNTKTGDMKDVIIDSRDGSVKNWETQVSSYYNQISAEDMKKHVAIWEKQSAITEELKTTALVENPEFLQHYSEMDLSRVKQVMTKVKTSDSNIKALLFQDGQKIISGLTHCTQYTDVWCGVATAQIISTKYMSDPWSQYHIADMMGAYNDDGTPKGTDMGMELLYYQPSEDDGGLGKGNSLDIYRPFTTWQAAHDEIEEGRPLKIGRDTPNNHARACNGWQVNGGNPYLLFYDPAQYGYIYWEYVAPGSTYNNFIYIR